MDSTYTSTAISKSQTIFKQNILSVSPLKFRRVQLSDMQDIRPYLMSARGRTTDFSFGGVAMWIDYFRYEFCIYRHTLFIKGVLEDDRNVAAFSVPVGEMSVKESIDLLRQYCRQNNLELMFSVVPEEYADDFREARAIKFEELADWEDYLYEAEKLASLTGKKMAKKRNHVNKFKSLYEGRWTYEEITVDNCAEALGFMDVFDIEGDDNSQAADERMLTRRILEEFPILTPYMTGGMLRVDGKVCAITLGDIKGDTMFVHIEKATRHIEGSYEMINHLYAEEQCRKNPQIKYINREDDAGDEGLRLAKQSYHPVALLKKYNVSF